MRRSTVSHLRFAITFDDTTKTIKSREMTMKKSVWWVSTVTLWATSTVCFTLTTLAIVGTFRCLLFASDTECAFPLQTVVLAGMGTQVFAVLSSRTRREAAREW
jgi:hypothetical protein